MDVTNMILTELEFPKLFSKYKKTDYGLFFYNEKNRLSRDSNHAILYGEKLSDLHLVLEKIKKFYLKKGLTPLLYHPFINGFLKMNRACLRSHGYSIRTYDDEMMQLTGENRIVVPRRLKIRRLTEWDEKIASRLCAPDHVGYAVCCMKKSLKNENYHLFVGYLDGVPVTTASLYYSEYGCVRMDDFETAKEFRNNGYAREMIGAVVDYHRRHSDADFYLWASNPTAKRIYEEAGFTRTQYQFESWTAEYVDK